MPLGFRCRLSANRPSRSVGHCRGDAGGYRGVRRLTTIQGGAADAALVTDAACALPGNGNGVGVIGRSHPCRSANGPGILGLAAALAKRHWCPSRDAIPSRSSTECHRDLETTVPPDGEHRAGRDLSELGTTDASSSRGLLIAAVRAALSRQVASMKGRRSTGPTSGVPGRPQQLGPARGTPTGHPGRRISSQRRVRSADLKRCSLLMSAMPALVSGWVSANRPQGGSATAGQRPVLSRCETARGRPGRGGKPPPGRW